MYLVPNFFVRTISFGSTEFVCILGEECDGDPHSLSERYRQQQKNTTLFGKSFVNTVYKYRMNHKRWCKIKRLRRRKKNTQQETDRPTRRGKNNNMRTVR